MGYKLKLFGFDQLKENHFNQPHFNLSFTLGVRTLFYLINHLSLQCLLAIKIHFNQKKKVIQKKMLSLLCKPLPLPPPPHTPQTLRKANFPESLSLIISTQN